MVLFAVRGNILKLGWTLAPGAGKCGGLCGLDRGSRRSRPYQSEGQGKYLYLIWTSNQFLG